MTAPEQALECLQCWLARQMARSWRTLRKLINLARCRLSSQCPTLKKGLTCSSGLAQTTFLLSTSSRSLTNTGTSWKIALTLNLDSWPCPASTAQMISSRKSVSVTEPTARQITNSHNTATSTAGTSSARISDSTASTKTSNCKEKKRSGGTTSNTYTRSALTSSIIIAPAWATKKSTSNTNSLNNASQTLSRQLLISNGKMTTQF